MKHYESEQWAAFKAGLVDLATAASMEEHLEHCEDCLDKFLSLISEEEIRDAALFVPETFSTFVMAALPSRPQPETALNQGSPRAAAVLPITTTLKKSAGRKRSNLLIAYASAAVITLFLMSNGFFSSLSTMAVATPDPADTGNVLAHQLVASEQELLDQYADRIQKANQGFIDALTLNFCKGGN